jgi:CO/xanthine dehydrogenase FAD-binding subunit
MKPAAFEYVRAATVDEAVASLVDGDGRVIAGGQSLVPLMNLRLAIPERIVDTNALDELATLRGDNGEVVIGALCRHRRLEFDDTVREQVPLLAEAASLIGHPSIRNRGTLGGSLAHADPAAELGAALLVLEGRIRARSAGAEREIAAGDLFKGFFTTSLEPIELVTEVTVPRRAPREGSAFVEFAPRRGDFAIVGAAARVVFDDDGRCSTARAAGCGLADVPVDLSAATARLMGSETADDESLRAVAADVPTLFDPGSDLHASADDRRELAQILIIEAIRRSWQRAGARR